MYAKIRPRRSTATEWSIINPVLYEGELVIENPDTGVGTGLCKFKIGDGVTPWNDLPYAFDAQSADSIYGGTVFVSHDICIRSGSKEDWLTEDPILKAAEIVYDETELALKIGNGVQKFSELKYIGKEDDKDKDYDFGDLDDPVPNDQV